MRVLISGITGFLGRHLACSLLDEGHTVWGFSNVLGDPMPQAQVQALDLLDADALTEYVLAAAPDAVFHLGGLSHVGASFGRPGDYFRVNVGGTRNLLRAVAATRPEGGANARIVVASSAEVYGAVPEDEQPIGEDRPLDPRSPYAMTKAATELLALDAGAIVTRSFNIVGPGQAQTFALPSFARQLARIAHQRETCASGPVDAVLRVGDLSPRRDFTPVDDAIAGYRILLEHGAPGTVYNIARGQTLSIGEILDRLCAVAGVEVEIRREESRVRPVDMPLLCGDSTRLRALGWRPSDDLDGVLERLWQAARGEIAEELVGDRE